MIDEYDLNYEIEMFESENKQLQDQLALTEKALELACEELWCMSVWQNTKEEVIQDYIQCFKTKAKEMMKDAQDKRQC